MSSLSRHQHDGRIRPLVTLDPGMEGLLEHLDVSKSLQKRFLALGLTSGARIRVIGSQHGPMIIAIRDSRLALSQGVASRIYVEIGVGA